MMLSDNANLFSVSSSPCRPTGLLVVRYWKCAMCCLSQAKCLIVATVLGTVWRQWLTRASIWAGSGRADAALSCAPTFPKTRLGTICCVTAIPLVVRQDLKPFFDTEIKGNPGKFEPRSNSALRPDELLARKSPRAGWGSWAAHRNRPLRFCRFSRQHHIALSEPILGLYVNRKSCANWLQTSQINTIFFNPCYYTAARRRYLQALPGNWQPHKTFGWFPILPPKKHYFHVLLGQGWLLSFRPSIPVP